MEKPANEALFPLAARHYTAASPISILHRETMRTYFGLLVLALLCDPAFAAAADPDPPKRPRIALVLSGGGARGLAHVGVLRN